MLEQQISFDYLLKSCVSVHIKKFGLITRCPIVGRHLGQNFDNPVNKLSTGFELGMVEGSRAVSLRLELKLF